MLVDKKEFLTFSRTLTKIFDFILFKCKIWNVDNIENWKRLDLTQNMTSKMLTLTQRKVLLLES